MVDADMVYLLQEDFKESFNNLLTDDQTLIIKELDLYQKSDLKMSSKGVAVRGKKSSWSSKIIHRHLETSSEVVQIKSPWQTDVSISTSINVLTPTHGQILYMVFKAKKIYACEQVNQTFQTFICNKKTKVIWQQQFMTLSPTKYFILFPKTRKQASNQGNTIFTGSLWVAFF